MKHLGIILMIFSLFSCKAQYKTPQEAFDASHKWLNKEEFEKKISVKELHEDIDYLYATLNEVHPDIYRYFSKEKFEGLMDSLKNNITEPLNRKEFYINIAPFVSKLNDAHTYMQFLDEEFGEYLRSDGLLFPVQVEISNSKIFVKKTYNELEKGTEIISINGNTSVEIINKMLPYITGESNNYREKLLENQFFRYLWLLYDLNDTFSLKTDTKIITIKGEKYADISKQFENVTHKNQYSYKKINNNTSILEILSFSDHIDSFSNFLDSIFSIISEEKIENLIIDARGNDGGNDMLVEALIEYIYDKPYSIYSRSEWRHSMKYEKFIKSIDLDMDLSDYYNTPVGKCLIQESGTKMSKHEKNIFKGNLYLLIDIYTFSGGVNLAQVVKDYKVGTIIGEETGNHATSFGNVFPFDLPNSRLSVRCSTSFYVRPSGSKEPGGVKPDYNAKPDENIIDFTMELIIKNNY